MTSILCKRPVAFRVPRVVDDKLSDSEWQLFADEKAAHDEAEAKGCDYQGLFVRDGTAIVAEWEPIGSAPTDGSFLVCAVGDDRGPFVVNGQILWQARKENTPSHLGLGYVTHWMPLPAPPPPALEQALGETNGLVFFRLVRALLYRGVRSRCLLALSRD